MEKTSNKLHAIIFPLPYQGHINPCINLAIKLASKGITITFVHTEHVHHTLIKAHKKDTDNQVDIFSQAQKSGLDIRYATISDGFSMDFDRALHFDLFWESILRDFPSRVDEFIGKIIESDPSLVPFLIVDTFFSWSTTIAKKYNLINVSFWTQTALVISIGFHLDLLAENGHFPWKDEVEEEITYIPGVKSINTKDLMPYLKESQIGTAVQTVSVKAFEEVKKADFILCNTMEELEFEAMSALNEIHPTYAIGPVNFFRSMTATTITKSLWAESDCIEWLNSKPSRSVLYVSFGSLAQITEQILEEIAYGLLLSEVNFIWVVREDIVSYVEGHVLPIGFEDEVRGRGLIIPWCDQLKVLSNPAVGGFLTHCGWNSILEGLWNRVPIICYPLIFDQPTNRKLVVDDWKIGISLCDGTSINREEVAEKIKNFMSGQELKEEAEKVKTLLHDAVEMNGSSDQKFDNFIMDLKDKIREKTYNGPRQNVQDEGGIPTL